MPDTTKRYSNKETNRLTREAICTALVLLMKEESFNKISITDIVRRAGVSRTAYYSNYSSKQEILYDLVDSLISEVNQKLLPYTDERTGKAKQPGIFIKVMFEVFYEQQNIYKTLYNAHFNHIILDRLNDSMLSHLKDRSDENIYRIYFNAGALYNVFSKWIQSDLSKTIDEMTEICLTIYHTPMSQEQNEEVYLNMLIRYCTYYEQSAFDTSTPLPPHSSPLKKQPKFLYCRLRKSQRDFD